MRKGLSYDDVLVVPNRSEINSRSDINITSTILPGITLSVPIISAPMDSVTGSELAQSMADLGGVGIIHRFCTPEEQADMVSEVDGLVGASIGIGSGELDRANTCIDAGADFICIDVAHGHLEDCLDFTEEFDEIFDYPLMVGNVATHEAAEELYESGADCVKVGVGPGSHCTTRTKTGVGVPQFTAVRSTEHTSPRVVADGGIRTPGDAVKALMGGANAVMMGGAFGRCEESLHDGVWGMASQKGKEQSNSDGYIEGRESSVDEKTTVDEVMENYIDGIRSGMSYIGGHTIDEARENASFVEITATTRERNGAFIK